MFVPVCVDSNQLKFCVVCVLMSKWVNVMLCLMYVSSPPPNFTTLSVRMGV